MWLFANVSCSLPRSLQPYPDYFNSWWNSCDHQKTCPRLSNPFHFKSLFPIYDDVDMLKAKIFTVECLPLSVSICLKFRCRWVCCFWDMLKKFCSIAKTSRCSEENPWCLRAGTKIWVRLSQRCAFGKGGQTAARLYLYRVCFRLRLQHPSRSLFAAPGAAARLPSSTQRLFPGGIGRGAWGKSMS